MEEARIVYYGEKRCEAFKHRTGEPCSNGAYFLVDKSYFCGVHANKNKRTQLPKNEVVNRQRRNKALEEHEELIQLRSEERRALGKKGAVACGTMYMMKEVPLRADYRLVFPNNKHQNRNDGFGCCALSPMRLGPVKHHQPSLPECLSIENYHQFNKVYPNEVDEKGDPTKAFRDRQRTAYLDPVPHRHKFEPDVMKKLREEVNGQNRNEPLYSVHQTRHGEERRFTYVQSRYFYCHFYETLAKRTPDFGKLQSMLEDGVNLQIMGYDGYPVNQDLYWHYCDPKKAFGHELVLYSLLVISEPSEYPWNLYRKAHSELYRDMIF